MLNIQIFFNISPNFTVFSQVQSGRAAPHFEGVSAGGGVLAGGENGGGADHAGGGGRQLPGAQPHPEQPDQPLRPRAHYVPRVP